MHTVKLIKIKVHFVFIKSLIDFENLYRYSNVLQQKYTSLKFLNIINS